MRKKAVFFFAFFAVCAVTGVLLFRKQEKSELYDILSQDNYVLSAQTQTALTLTIPKASLPDDIYTPEGREFGKEEVAAYQTDTTSIYLSKAMLSNESDELLYFTFDFSYQLPSQGRLLTPLLYDKDTDSMYHEVQLRSDALKDRQKSYPNTVSIRGYGPENQITFYISAEACRSAKDVILIDVICSEITYARDS